MVERRLRLLAFKLMIFFSSTPHFLLLFFLTYTSYFLEALGWSLKFQRVKSFKPPLSLTHLNSKTPTNLETSKKCRLEK